MLDTYVAYTSLLYTRKQNSSTVINIFRRHSGNQKVHKEQNTKLEANTAVCVVMIASDMQYKRTNVLSVQHTALCHSVSCQLLWNAEK